MTDSSPTRQSGLPPHHPAVNGAAASASDSSACPVMKARPVDGKTLVAVETPLFGLVPPVVVDAANNMPATPEQTAAATGLSTDRMVSSIARGAFKPDHQREGAARWEYPSEAMFYNAMKRKGWAPNAGDMPVVVAIHNNVNERAWGEVMKWEAMHKCEDVRLFKFVGRPTELSPKARVRTWMGCVRTFTARPK